MSEATAPDARAAARIWLATESRRGRRAAWPVVLAGLGSTVLAVGQAWCVATALVAALHGLAAPLPWLALFAVLALARAGLGLVSERAGFEAGAAARRRLRSDVLGRMLDAGPALLRRRHSGELTTILVDRIEALDGLFRSWLPAATLAVAAPLLVAIALLPVDWTAAVLLLLCGLLVPFAMALAGLGAAAASRRQFAAMTRLQARFLDRVRGIATIVLAGRTDDEAAALGRAADELRRRTMRVLRVAFLSSAALDCAAALALVLLALRYGSQLAAGGGDAATALFALLLVPEFFAPLRAFSAAYQEQMQARISAEALVALPLARPAPPPHAVRNVAARGVAVAFENVSLTWDPARGPALDGLSFKVPAGEVLVLAGPSGAGKSSVMEVLLGFVRPDSGRVTINGADITTLVPQALARLIAWVGQRPVLFAGSIRDNIRFARPDASEAEIAEAARLARLDSVAASLPQGLDTAIGEGGYGLSGGQAQRVAIARAFLKNAPVLLMDEPTAHLDPLTEGEVLDSLRRLTVGRTVILASHSAAAHSFGGRRLDIRDGRAVRALGVA